MPSPRKVAVIVNGLLLAVWIVFGERLTRGRPIIALYLSAVIFIVSLVFGGWTLWKDAERRDKEYERFLVEKTPEQAVTGGTKRASEMPYWDSQRKLGALAVLINLAVLWKAVEAVSAFHNSEGWTTTTTVFPWLLVLQVSTWITLRVARRPAVEH